MRAWSVTSTGRSLRQVHGSPRVATGRGPCEGVVGGEEGGRGVCVGVGVGVGVLFWSAMLVSGCSTHARTHTQTERVVDLVGEGD